MAVRTTKTAEHEEYCEPKTCGGEKMLADEERVRSIARSRPTRLREQYSSAEKHMPHAVPEAERENFANRRCVGRREDACG